MITSAMSKNNNRITKNFCKSSFKIQNFSGKIWKRQIKVIVTGKKCSNSLLNIDV